MAGFTFADLRQALREAAGDDDNLELTPHALDTELVDLGYDSLAMLEVAAIVERRYGVKIPDDTVLAGNTPREVMDALNETLAVLATTVVAA
jgi:act minimal PKS acyl carrier protein